MRVESGKQASSSRSGAAPRDAKLAPAEHEPESRALVVTEPTAVQAPTVNYRQAAFLAHLIATKDQCPQTRQRRRAEPADAIAAYRTVQAITNHYVPVSQ
jgi:hypothetical protein